MDIKINKYTKIFLSLLMIIVSICFFGICIISYKNPAEIIMCFIFIPFGITSFFFSWKLVRECFYKAEYSIITNLFLCFFSFSIAGFFHPASIVPVIIAVFFTVITYIYRKKKIESLKKEKRK